MKPTCEACGYQGKSRKIRTVGNYFAKTRMVVDACRKCNWFLFESEAHKERVLYLWKNN